MISTLLITTILMITPVENDTSKLVSMLSWESFEIHTTTYVTEIAFVDSASKELSKIGKSATPFLFESILDKNKGVAIHLILTKIWSPKNFKANLNYSHLSAQENFTSVNLSVNNLTWDITEDGKNSVEIVELQEIKKYWQNKLPEKFTQN